MKTRRISNKGDLNLYSFKDLEYAVKLLRMEIKEINIAKKVVLQLESDHVKGRRINKQRIENILHPYDLRIERIKEIIAYAENDLLDRLLTGNDDGAVERELIGVIDV